MHSLPVWQVDFQTSESFMQAGMSVVLAATIAFTSPSAYAAPFETGTGLAPLGELFQSQAVSILSYCIFGEFTSAAYVWILCHVWW